MAPTKPQLTASTDASAQRLTDGANHSIASSQAARLGQPSNAFDASTRERFVFVFGVVLSRILGEPNLPPPAAQDMAIEQPRREDNRVIDVILGPRRQAAIVEEDPVEAPPPQPPHQENVVENGNVNSIDEVEAAGPSAPNDQPDEDVEEVVAEPTEDIEETPSTSTPRAPKRKMEEDPMDKYDQTPRKIRSVEKRVRFSRRVEVEHRRRTLAICGRRPFVLMGSPILRDFQPLRRPTVHVRPRRFSRETIESLAAVADPETVPILDESPRPSGCRDTCETEGCQEDCSCVAQGLHCSQRYGCRCDNTRCRNHKHTPATMLEHVRRKMGLVEEANDKTAEWEAREDSTISSVGSCSLDEEEADASDNDQIMEEDEDDLSNVAMIGEEDGAEGSEAAVEDEEMEDREADESAVVEMFDDENDEEEEADIAELNNDEFGTCEMDWSPPPSSPLDESEMGNSSDDKPQMDSTMVLCEDDDDDAAANLPPSDPPSEPSDGSSSDSDEEEDEDDGDDDDDNGSPGFDMAPEEFSSHLLRQLPAMLDQGEIDSCNIGQFLGGDALFVGLLGVATAAKQSTGSKCAVCHPEVFEAARLTLEAEGTGSPAVLTRSLVSRYTAYGHDWNDLVIPMLINGHWIVGVIRKSLVSVTIYDSSRVPGSKDMVVRAMKKIIATLVELNPADGILTRFKIKYSREGCRDIQMDGTSCGVFVVNHVRRALSRSSCSAARRAGDQPIDVAKERMELKRKLVNLVGVFQQFAANGLRWRHAQGGQLPLRSARTLIALNYNGRRH